MCFFFLLLLRTPRSTLFPYTTLFRSTTTVCVLDWLYMSRPKSKLRGSEYKAGEGTIVPPCILSPGVWISDRKSTRLNSSHTVISYAVFCLKKKKNNDE